MLLNYLLHIGVSLFIIVHPIKMTFSDLDISDGENVTVSTRFFLDDLSYHLEHTYRLKKADFSSTNANGTKSLQLYINDHFYILQNGEKKTFNITEIKMDVENIVLTMKGVLKTTLKTTESFEVKNNVLFEVFTKQENQLKVITIDNTERYSLKNETSKLVISLD